MTIENNLRQTFSLPLLTWYDTHGRKNFPWQHPRTAYRVWISEIMLQQTQVQTVIPYFERFMESFPTIHDLHKATDDQVLSHWSGLGYYSRARNLHKTAMIIVNEHAGLFPTQLNQLMELPGIGESTAAAILSQAFNQPTAILDGNVKRVLTRYFMIDGWPGQSSVNKQLWNLAYRCMSETRCADYTQAIMDLGATCCTRSKPDCLNCPLQTTCLAKLNNVVSNYPFKKIKKNLPIKQQQFLLLYNRAKDIYLAKRPPVGIWGGLWCLPSIETNDDPQEFIEKTLNFQCKSIHSLLDIKHTFSHFHLYINALAIEVESCESECAEEDAGWFHREGFSSLGLAKPVSQIIHRFLSISSS